jgi:hypothetical protein
VERKEKKQSKVGGTMNETDDEVNPDVGENTTGGDAVVCEECNQDVATGMYLNVCMTAEQSETNPGGDPDLNCEVLFDQLKNGDISNDELKQSIRKHVGDKDLEILDTVDSLERGEDVDVGDIKTDSGGLDSDE